MYRYSVRYRRLNYPSSRVFRMTVTAKDADEARRMAMIADPFFFRTVASPKRRGEVFPPDGMDEAKARAFLQGEAVFER